MASRLARTARIALPAALAAVLLVLAGTAVVRGTRADAAARLPATVAEGPLVQVLACPGEGTCVHAAIRLPHSLQRVWGVVTRYERLAEVCPYLHPARVEHDPSRRARVRAWVDTGLGGRLPVEAELREEQDLYQYRCSWDEPSGNVLVNRGRWQVTSLGPEEAILELFLEVQVRHVPTFILRNSSLDRLPRVLRAVEGILRTGNHDGVW